VVVSDFVKIDRFRLRILFPFLRYYEAIKCLRYQSLTTPNTSVTVHFIKLLFLSPKKTNAVAPGSASTPLIDSSIHY